MCLQSITTVERQVMTSLFWPNNPVLPSVHPAEGWVVELRARIEAAMLNAFPPLQVGMLALFLFDAITA